MRENELSRLISEAMRKAPPAPDELRHNVMERIYESEEKPGNLLGRTNRRLNKIMPVVASLGIIAFLSGVLFIKSINPSKTDSAQQVSESTQFALCTTKNDEDMDNGAFLENGADSLPQEKTSKQLYIITGELPWQLEGYEYKEHPDGSRLYTVPHHIYLEISDFAEEDSTPLEHGATEDGDESERRGEEGEVSEGKEEIFVDIHWFFEEN